jgi:hypothetical protein
VVHVTIVPREKFPLGHTVLKVNEQRELTYQFTRRYLQEQLLMVLAGAFAPPGCETLTGREHELDGNSDRDLRLDSTVKFSSSGGFAKLTLRHALRLVMSAAGHQKLEHVL